MRSAFVAKPAELVVRSDETQPKRLTYGIGGRARRVSDCRKDHNADVLKRMKQGDDLMPYSASDTWVPPRPKIKKDRKAIDLLHGRLTPTKHTAFATHKKSENTGKHDANDGCNPPI